MTARWAKRDRLLRGKSGCRYCLSLRLGNVDCPLATCKACGSVQCCSYGSSRGQCGVCYVGVTDYEPEHDRPCGYKGCPERAVAEAPRVRQVCAQHACKAKKPCGETVADFIIDRMAEREKIWVLVDLGARP